LPFPGFEQESAPEAAPAQEVLHAEIIHDAKASGEETAFRLGLGDAQAT
jgi:hypothetical protein